MAIFPMENKGAVENMRESKLKPLTAAEKKSAEENHNIIYAFLKQYGYSIEEHYNIPQRKAAIKQKRIILFVDARAIMHLSTGICVPFLSGTKFPCKHSYERMIL